MPIKLLPKRSKRGFTLTEAAIVLGVLGLLLGAIWVAASSVYENMRVGAANKSLLNLVSNIRKLYQGQPSIDLGISASGLATTGAVPRDMIDETVMPIRVLHEWNDEVEISQATVAFTGDSFQVSLENIPRRACADLLVLTTGSGQSVGLVSLSVNATPVASLPVTSTAASTACVAGANNTLSYTFLLKV